MISEKKSSQTNTCALALYVRVCSGNVRTDWYLYSHLQWIHPCHVQSFSNNSKGHLWPLDQENHTWFRKSPELQRVSNLPRLSQLIERRLCSISQPSGYEWSMWSFPSSLQAVTQYGSSITSCTNDIFQAIDSCGGAILVIHDLSAAFDMIAQEKPMLTLN